MAAKDEKKAEQTAEAAAANAELTIAETDATKAEADALRHVSEFGRPPAGWTYTPGATPAVKKIAADG